MTLILLPPIPILIREGMFLQFLKLF